MLTIIVPSFILTTLIVVQYPNTASWLWPLVASVQFVGCFIVVLVQFDRRIRKPLEAFQTMLENISEGFMPEDVPEELFRRADPVVSEAYRNVIQINQMMLRNVDHLEKGFEEERLGKLRQIELTQAYGRFVPHEFLDNLGKTSIVDIRLGDHVRTQMTVLFCDIRAFTALSENMSPEETFRFLNAYMSYMEPIVKEHGGFIDKFIGDAIMALFHSPDEAVRAALSMLDQLQEFNISRLDDGSLPIEVGIGINTGTLMLGVVGGKNRMESTVVSDAVNVASRIESMNKVFGSQILISESTQAALDKPELYTLRKFDHVMIEGKSSTISIYEVIRSERRDA
jgi:class 3 adenylate cyclase